MPFRALLTTDSIPQEFKNRHPNSTVHGLLSSFLAFDEHRKDEYKPWMNLWPSPEVFQETMPFGWLRNQPDVASPLGCGLLPPSIGGSWAHPNISEFQILEGHGLLQKQMRRLKQDWIIVSSAIAEISFDRYVYYWLIVNTRSLYFEMPNTKVHPPREDRMVLCPFIDFFNHDDHGVSAW